MRAFLPLLPSLLLCGACPTPVVTLGNTSSSSSSSGGVCCERGTGTLAGTLAFDAGYVRSSPVRVDVDAGPSPFRSRSVQLGNAGACPGEGTTGTLQSVSLSVSRHDGQEVGVGTFPVTDEGYTWPNDAGVGGPHGESCLVMLSRFSARDGGTLARSRSGTVRFTEVTAARVTGELDVTFDDGEVSGTLSATFDAPACAQGQAAAGPMP